MRCRRTLWTVKRTQSKFLLLKTHKIDQIKLKMEPNDEVVERQKLVPNDVETEEEAKSAQTPATPVAVPKINVKHTPNPTPLLTNSQQHFVFYTQIKGISSGETTRSRNSASCSIERTISEKGQGQGQQQQTSAKTTLQYVNERRPRPHAQGNNNAAGDERFEFKTRPRKLLKGKPHIAKNKYFRFSTSLQSLWTLTSASHAKELTIVYLPTGVWRTYGHMLLTLHFLTQIQDTCCKVDIISII